MSWMMHALDDAVEEDWQQQSTKLHKASTGISSSCQSSPVEMQLLHHGAAAFVHTHPATCSYMQACIQPRGRTACLQMQPASMKISQDVSMESMHMWPDSSYIPSHI